MSKASEWAKRYKDAERQTLKVRGERPETCVLPLSGPAGVRLKVDDFGNPVISFTGFSVDEDFTVFGQFYCTKLLEAARWILDTFEDKQGGSDITSEDLARAVSKP